MIGEQVIQFLQEKTALTIDQCVQLMLAKEPQTSAVLVREVIIELMMENILIYHENDKTVSIRRVYTANLLYYQSEKPDTKNVSP